MPTVAIPRDRLFDLVGKQFSEEEFDELCFEFGLELDGVTVEAPSLGSRALSVTDAAAAEEVVTYKVEVPANRYDLLCVEGLAQALRVFLGSEPTPNYTLSKKPAAVMKVREEVAGVRPYVVCAVLKDMQMDDDIYQSLIDLQDKLHQNICRRRTLVAIGTHDMDKIEAPFTYEALAPEGISFVPLGKDEAYDGHALMRLYETDPQLKQYLPIIRDSPRYPYIMDAQRRVLSMPPIINGDHSKISPSTRNMFIECTATDLTKANIVLNILVAMFSRYCAVPFSVHAVEIHYPNGDTHVTPDFSTPKLSATAAYINTSVGIDIATADMVCHLARMQVPAIAIEDTSLEVNVPIIRPDLLAPCDIMCDVAIGYGFNNVTERVPSTSTVGRQQPLNHLADLVRREALAQQCYTEVLTWVTVSAAENFELLRRVDDGTKAVVLGNPKTVEFQQCRTSLLPGLLKTLRENRRSKVPIRLFEVGDVVLKDKTAEVLAKNRRHVAAVYCATNAGFEIVQGLLEHLMTTLSVAKGDGTNGTWRIDAANCTDEAFFEGRRASVVYNGQQIGVVGWLHPEVLTNFSLSYPCSALEIDLEVFL